MNAHKDIKTAPYPKQDTHTDGHSDLSQGKGGQSRDGGKEFEGEHSGWLKMDCWTDWVIG